MQSIIALALGLLATTVVAQGTQGLPPCAQECVTKQQGGQQGYGGCTSLDVKCICTASTFISDLACCVSTACDQAGQDATIQFAQAICGSEDAASALPTTATCASTASATGSSSSSTSMAASGTTSMPASGSASATTSAAAAGTSGAASGLQVQGAGLLLGLVGLVAAL